MHTQVYRCMGVCVCGLCVLGHVVGVAYDVASEDCDAQVCLLQQAEPVLISQQEEAESPMTRNIGAPELLAWFHCPKCSTGFANTLVHYANSSLPEDAMIKDDTGSTNTDFVDKYSEDDWCSEQRALDPFAPVGGNSPPHAGISQSAWNEHQGRFVGIFRNPKERMHSSWNVFTSGSDPETYARSASGIVTKMLTGQQDGLICSYTEGSRWHPEDQKCNRSEAPDVKLALDRLDGFRFVGLQEHFSLSICLFHTVVGGECLPVDFLKVRAGAYDKPREAEAKQVFEETVDVADTAVYTRAQAIFWRSVAQNGLNRSACEKLCPKVDPVEFESLDDLVQRAL